MAVLYHWVGGRYREEMAEGLDDQDLTLYQNSPTMQRAGGHRLYAFTRREDGTYVLAAEMLVGKARLAPPGGELYMVEAVSGSTRWFDVDAGADFEPIIRRLEIPAKAATLGHSFQGSAAVRLISAADEIRIAAFADAQPLRDVEDDSSADEDGAIDLIAELSDVAEDLEAADSFDVEDDHDARVFTLEAIALRQGQPAFRKALFAAYEARCAITGCDVAEALEAAHIMPYRGTHTNDVRNGLLLRADLHTLFDLGLLRIEPGSCTIELAPVMTGSAYRELEGQTLRLPRASRQRPDPDALRSKYAAHTDA